MNPISEIAIVGGGPVGAFTALSLAKLGLAQKTVVFEEHNVIGRPSHCAGHLNIKTLEMLGLKLPSKIVENMIRGAKFYSPSGLTFQVKREKPVTVVVNRELFDKLIAEKAEKLGVNFQLECRVERLLVENRKVKGLVFRNAAREKSEIFHSNVVIDAEGYPAKLLEKAGFPHPNVENCVFGGQAEIEEIKDVQLDMVELYFGKETAPGFFAWIIPKRDGTAKVGLAVKHGDPKRYLMNFISKHPVASEKLRKSRILRVSFHPIPLAGPITKTYDENLIAVGDAAGHVKPTTGGGVITGLICARIAAETIHKAFKMNDYSEKVLAEYQKKWMRKLGFEFRAMLKLRRFLDRLSDRQVDKLFEACIRAGLNEALEEVGDVDFQGRTLLHAAFKPKGLIPFLRLVWSALTGR